MMSGLVQQDSTVSSPKSAEKETVLSELLNAVKQCQIRFGGRAELATESDSRVAVLCNTLEAALSHGLRPKPVSKANSTFRQMTEIVSSSFHLNRTTAQDHIVLWHYVREHLTRHEYERYMLLRQVSTDIGRGRAWLRSALNESSLERYLHILLGSPALLAAFYEDWSLMQDQERSSMLPTMAAGLGSILFAISIDNAEFNAPSKSPDKESTGPAFSHTEPLITATSTPDSNVKRKQEQRRRKRVPAQIINFDDEPSGSEAIVGSPVTSDSAMSEKTAIFSDTLDSQESWGPVENGVEELPQPIVKSLPGATPNARPQELPLPSTSIPNRYSHQVSRNSTQTLTPVNNVSVGELIPVSMTDEAQSEEDSLSVPSYSEDTECAAAALLATQKLLESNCVDFSSQDISTRISQFTSESVSQSNGEVREALVSVLALKEELQAEMRVLKKLLEQSQEARTHLQAELTESGRQHAEKVERLETRIQALVRENELLKHQLRKYVGAVQMLKRDGTQAHEALASMEATQPRPVDALDYHNEAREYEKKLIQVAEMHGELMEFNERLHRQLQAKDAAIRRLREELIDLRGPLPDDAATSDDDVSITSDYDNSSLCAAARALVNIWIPSAFLTGGSSDVHHVYQVFIRIRDDEWNIYRRYAQFYSLHKQLKKQDAVVSTFDFPPKKTLGNKDARFVEERRRRLQHYLRCVMNHLVQNNSDLATSPDKELLVSLIPFFGDLCNTEDKSRRRRGTSRNPFSRLSRSVDQNTSGNSPQYTGL